MIFLTFTNYNDAEIAANKIWYNYIMSKANNEEKLVGKDGIYYYLSDLQLMTEAQVTALYVFGKCQGIIEYNCGNTTEYAKPFQTLSDPNLYVFIKPLNDSLLVGVSNYIEQEEVPAWFGN